MNDPGQGLTSHFLDQAPALRLLIPFALGILLAEWGALPIHTTPYIIVTTCGLTLSCLLLLTWRKKLGHGVADKFFVTLMFATTACGGVLADHFFYRSLSTQWPQTSRIWQGVVTDPAKVSAHTIRINLAVNMGNEWRNVTLSLKKGATDSVPCVGEALCFKSKISRPVSKSRHTGFDYALWLRRQGVEGVAYVSDSLSRPAATIARSLTNNLPLLVRLKIRALTLRQQLATRYTTLTNRRPELSLLSAITLGDKSLLTKDTRSAFSDAGVSHILALSGLHLGILTMFLMMLLRPLRLYRWSQCLMVAICVGLTWGFAALTGLSVSVVRSATMLSLLLLLSLRGEGYSSLNDVVIAALLILLFSPTSIMDLSFQLSFLSVGALICFMPRYQESALRQRMGRCKFVLDFVFVSVVAQLATAPLVALIFGQLPTYFLLANMIAIPCAYIILISSLGFALMGNVSIIGGATGWVAAKSTSLLLWWTIWTSSLPGSTFALHLTPISCALTYIALLLAAWWLTAHHRNYLYLALLAIGLCISTAVWGI